MSTDNFSNINSFINTDELNRINDFIKNPIQVGLWETIFELKSDSKILELLNDDYREDNYDFPSNYYKNNRRGTNRRYHPINILDIFYNLTLKKEEDFLKEEEDFFDVYRKKFKKNFEENKEKIHSMELRKENMIIINGEVAYIFQFPDRVGKFIILSVYNNILKIIQDIFEACDYFSSSKSKLIFSPKTKLLNHLFYFTNIISNNLFVDYEIKKNFEQSNQNKFKIQSRYPNYEEVMYPLGKASEALLTNIYESIFREYAPDGSTLGNLRDLIQSQVEEICKSDKKKREPADFEKIYKMCNSIKEDNYDLKIDKIVPILQQITTLLKKEQEYRDYSKKNKSHIENTIFPKYIRVNLNKLLYYRNSVSHNSGINFDIHDCNSMLFYFLSVYNWWQDVSEHDEIKWSSKDREDTIKDLVKLTKKENSNSKLSPFVSEDKEYKKPSEEILKTIDLLSESIIGF